MIRILQLMGFRRERKIEPTNRLMLMVLAAAVEQAGGRLHVTGRSLIYLPSDVALLFENDDGGGYYVSLKGAK